MPREYYEVLGVSEDASQKEIKKAYRKKAKKYHPDSGSDQADEEQFKKANKAYQVLSDEEKRQKYDRFGKQGVDASAAGGAGGFGGFQDLFESIFGGGHSGRRRESRGQHMKIPVTVSLEDAYTGLEKTFDVTREIQCPDCNGSGAENGNTDTCPECSGRGRTEQVKRTPFGRARTVGECPECSGRGQLPKTPCSECNGNGVRKSKDTLTIDIPAGVHNGQRLRLRNKGHENRDGNSGDLFVFVEVEDHPELERRENDLFTTVRIGVGDAALGATVNVPTPDGNIEMEIPEGTQPGQVLRAQGKGMPQQTRSRTTYGDLYIKVDVNIPSDVTEEQRTVLNELKEQPEQEKNFFETVKDIIT